MTDPAKEQSPSGERKPAGLRRGFLIWMSVAIVGLGASMYTLVQNETSSPDAPNVPDAGIPHPQAASPRRIPSHFESADSGRPFPKTLSPEIFDDPVVVKAYEVARAIPDVLVQQPCYCWCEGHGSLLGCHTTRHAED